MIDTAGNFQGKYHYTITDGLIAKLQTMVKLFFIICVWNYL